MTNKMIALTHPGTEYMYDPNTAHAVSKAGAQKIADALNAANYKTAGGRIWYVYDRGAYEDTYTMAGTVKFVQTKTRILEKYI